MTKAKRIYALWQALFAGGTMVTGGTMLTDTLGQRQGGMIIVLFGALHMAVTTYYVTTASTPPGAGVAP